MSTDTAKRVTTADPMIGEILGGRYVIERLIGRGGMGLVYLASEDSSDDDVVIKMVAPHWADDRDALARFQREGDRLAELRHPNIVELFDVGRVGGQAFLVMEYIEGIPLRRFLAKRALPFEVFAPIASQILAAVGYAHAQNMMLRDIKPSNIMLCERDGKANYVKLLDFGLAKLVDGDDVEITKAHVIGTAGYLAPEQIRGESTDVRVDVYALGILFFLMLTGKSPIVGDSDGAVLYNHVHGEPLRLSDELPDGHSVPSELIELVHRCMAKDPDDRPADANEMAEALFECVSPDLLALPEATEQTRAAIAKYQRQRLGIESASEDDEQDDSGPDPLSAEWTKPVLRRPLPKGAKDLTDAAKEAATTVPAQGRSPAATSNKTQMGLPAVGDVEPDPPAGPRRRPPPAKVDPRRRKLLRTGPRRAVRETGPRQIVSGTGPRQAIRRTGPRRGPHSAVPRPVPPPPPRSARTRPAGSRAATQPVDDELAGATLTGAPSPPVVAPPSSPLSVVPRPSAVAADPSGAVPLHPAGQTIPSGGHRLQQEISAPWPRAAQAVPQDVGGVYSGPIATGTPGTRSLQLSVGLVVAAVMALVLGGGVAWVMSTDSSDGDDGVAQAPSSTDVPDAPSEPEPSPQPAQLSTPDAKATADADPVVEVGRMHITTSKPVEGARVYIDGEDRGAAPFEGEIMVGTHRVEVRAAGHEAWAEELEVTAGDNAPVQAVLSRRGRRPGLGRRNNKGSQPSPTQPAEPTDKPSKTPSPFDPVPPADKPAAPKKEPKGGRNDDVFMPSAKKKDDGIFLPVGKKE